MKKTPGLMTSHPPPLNRENFRAMALPLEMAEMQDEIERLREENERLITCNSDTSIAVEVVTVTLRILRIQTCYRLFSYVGAEFENGVNLRKVCERFCILQIIKKT